VKAGENLTRCVSAPVYQDTSASTRSVTVTDPYNPAEVQVKINDLFKGGLVGMQGFLPLSTQSPDKLVCLHTLNGVLKAYTCLAVPLEQLHVLTEATHACMPAGLVATPAATEESSEEAVAAMSQTLQPVVSLFTLRSGTAVNFLLHHVPLLSMQSCSLPCSLRLALFACATTIECGTMQ